MDMEAEHQSTDPIDKEVHEVEDFLRGPSELGHPALDPDELNQCDGGDEGVGGGEGEEGPVLPLGRLVDIVPPAPERGGSRGGGTGRGSGGSS